MNKTSGLWDLPRQPTPHSFTRKPGIWPPRPHAHSPEPVLPQPKTLCCFLCLTSTIYQRFFCHLPSDLPRPVSHVFYASITSWVYLLINQNSAIWILVQFSSVAQLCPTLWDPMDCSMPGFPVHHQLPELSQTHVHRVGDAIQPSHPLLSPSPPAFNLSQHQGLFKWVSSSHQVSKVLEFQLQHQSSQWIVRTDFLLDGLVGSPCHPRNSQESSPTPQFKSISSPVLSFLYGPTLTSIHDHWKNHRFD